MKTKSLREKKRERTGLLFVMPSMIIFTVFVFVPLIISFVFSLLKFDMMFNHIEFQKLDNYKKLLGDGRFWNALWNTVYFTLFSVPLLIGLALIVVFRILQISLFYSGHLLYDDRFYFVEFFGQSGHRGIQLLAQSARSKTDQCAEQSEMGHAHRYSGRRLEKFWF